MTASSNTTGFTSPADGHDAKYDAPMVSHYYVIGALLGAGVTLLMPGDGDAFRGALNGALAGCVPAFAAIARSIVLHRRQCESSNS